METHIFGDLWDLAIRQTQQYQPNTAYCMHIAGWDYSWGKNPFLP